MKETRFIAQNKEKWLESETLLSSPVKDPEKLSSLFTQIVDDLSYSRTYYPNRSVRVYLNKIARQYFSIIYSHKRERKNRFSLFWLDELPQIILYCRKQLLISLIVFVLAATIGIFSAYNDPEFTGTILGESYVSMTKENIEKGDPMAVYKESHQIDMFLGITLNNLIVAFRTYVFGVFMAVGSLAILLYNGIMVGCFQYFFIERGLFAESALTIWLHGTLEISSIILAGGAGLTLGTGLIFPGTYSRLQAFQISAIRSLKLMLGITPIFVLAAIIESFLTRYTEVPDALRLLLIVLSASFIIGYFVIYPWMKSRSGFEFPLKEIKLPPSVLEPVSYSRLKTNAEILKDTFLFYSRHASKLLSWIVAVSIGATVFSVFAESEQTTVVYVNEWWKELFASMFFALRTTAPLSILVNTVCTSLILYCTLKLLDADAKKISFSWNVKSFVQILLISSTMYTAIYLGGWGIFFLICTFTILLLVAFTQLAERTGLLSALSQGWSLFTARTYQLLELQVILVLLGFSFLMVLSAPLIYIYTEILQWNFAETDVWAKYIVNFAEAFIKNISFYLIVPILGASTAYLYFTLQEISSATSLKESIARFGIRTSKNSRR